MMLLRLFLVGLSLTACCCASLSAQVARRWSLHLHGGYQLASAVPMQGRFTDVLFGTPQSTWAYGGDITFYGNRYWGVFLAARFSQHRRDWPVTLQRALERDYAGQYVRVALSPPWKNDIDQGFLGARGRWVSGPVVLLPSLAIGYMEAWTATTGADVKSVGSHGLLNVVAVPGVTGSWYMSPAGQAGLMAEWPAHKRVRLTASLCYTYQHTRLRFDVAEVNQVAYTRREEAVVYKVAPHLLVLSLGVSAHWGRTLP